MADGDITTITEYGRFEIPGGGHDTSGVAKNNKVLVWGRLVGTYDTLGLSFSAAGSVKALGLTNLDFVTFDVRYCGTTATTVPTDKKLFLACMERTAAATGQDNIFVADQVGQDTPAEPSDAESVTIDFLACGESANTPKMV